MTSEIIRERLKEVKYPGFSRDIVSFGLVREVSCENGEAQVKVEVTTEDAKIPAEIKANIEQSLKNLEGVTSVEVNMVMNQPKGKVASQATNAESKADNMAGVKWAIAIASGKGGVGKSTFAVNLACAMEKILDKGVGLMDCDIYGPSTPLMIGLNSRPEVEGNDILPLENFGVKVMSMGFLIDEDAPVVWRGPMVMKAIQQFAGNVRWGELEIVLIDLPPGTGDAQLSLVQTVPLDGAVIVTTPQMAATQIALRGGKMFDKVNVPILGVAENMSYLEQKGGERQYIFGKDGGIETAKGLKTDLLGQVALDPDLRESADNGLPIVISRPESSTAKAFMAIAKSILEKLEKNS